MQDGRRSSVSPPRRSSFTDHGSRRFSGSLSSTGGAQSGRLRVPPDLSGPIRSPAAYSGPIRSPGGHSGPIRSPYAGSIDSHHSRRFSDISGESYVEWIAPTPKSRRASALPSPGAGNWRTSVSNERSGWGGSLGFAMSPMVAPIDIRSSRPLASEFYGLKRGWDTPRQSSVQTPLYGEVGDLEGHREFLEQWRDREIATPRHSFAAPSPAPSNYERGRKSVKSDTSGRPFRSPTPTGRKRDSVDRVGRVAGLRSPVRPVDPEEGVSLAQDDGLKSSVWDYTLDSSENLRPIGHAAKEQQEEGGFDDVEEEEEEGEEPKTGAQAVGFFGLFVFADFLDKILMLIGALGAIINGGALPWYSLLFGRLVNTLGQNQNDTSKLMHEVRQICFYMIGLSLIIFVGSYLEVTCWMLAADRQATRIRTRYLRAVLRQDVGFFDTVISTGEVMNNISADVAIIQDAIGEKVGNFIHHLATFVSGYTVGILKSWKVSLVVFAVTPLMIICGKVQRTVYIDLASKEEEAYFEAGNLAEQALSAIRTVYSFVAEDQFTARYSDLLAKSLPFGLKVGFARGLGIGIIYLVMYGTWALALWYGSVLIQKGELSGGAAIACFFGVIVGGKGLGLAAPYLANFAQGGVAAFRVFGMINRVPIIDVDEPDGKIPNEVQGTIEFQKVDFTYPARLDVQIFKNFSLTVPAGKTVALVGPSGSGKSTAFALLERFYDPDKGSVLLDRVDIRELQLRWLRKQIGLVGQEPVLYATTIGDNISYGKEGASMKEIIKAAQAANADSFIQLLTDKYDTQVGERGVQLSGGQKQRIAIARAVLKNPKILLLDEATSALDTESEQIVQEALDRMMVKRTTMVIAHRLSTIRNVDLIAVVSNGEVVELGKHEQLMAKGGVYFSLVNMTNANTDKGALPVKARNSEGMTPMMTPYQAMTPAKNVSEVESVHGVEKVQAPEKPNVKLSDILALSKTEIPLLILGFFNAINAGIIFPFFAFIMGQVVYVYFNEDHAKMRRQVNLWASVYIGLGILAIISMTGQHGFSNWAGIRLTRRVREKLFETLLRQEVGWFDKDENTSGAILSRLSADSAYVRGLLGDRFSILFMGVAAIGVGLIICAILNLKMTLVAIAVTPIFLGANYMQIILNVGVGGQDDVYARAGSIAAEAIGNIRTVASFASEDKVVTLFNRALSLPLQQSFKSAQTAGASLGASQALMYGGYTLTLWYGSTLVQKGETNFGVVLKIFLILILSSFSVGQIAQMAPDSSKSVAAAQSVFSILKRKPKIDVLDPKANRLEKVKGTIEFQKVCFSYPARPHIPIFQQFNLKIPSGCTLALVGSSGSGKSTVISLIQRFYDPDSGKVLLDGTDIGLLKVKWLRQQMSLVGQEPVLFAGTIQENILHGKQDATTQEVEQAARAANVHSFICSLADGYDTQVGERGVQLSGGQKQRIAIARAVLKDPKILLLDEATSALDTESEHKVQVALEKISRDRTTVIVAHRLSTVRNADKIAVVRKGEVVEVGTHDRLMEDPDGVYYHLVSLQLNSQ